jgi:DNA (cytosine-5)-methyltransferase 1
LEVSSSLRAGKSEDRKLLVCEELEIAMIKAIDFFCGAGGLTRGLLDARISVLAGIDNDPTLRSTYESNNRPSRFLCMDVNDVNMTDLRNELGIGKSDRVLYSACTPCQPFSSLNRMQRDDERKVLLLKFAALVEQSPPHYIVVENVPGLNSAYGRDIYERFREILARSGFNHIFESMLDAKDYGVPQVRKRLIMIASRIGPVAAPRKSRRKPTVEYAISKFPPIEAGGKSEMYHNHVARELTPHLRAIVAAVPHDGGSRRDVPDPSILLQCHKERPNVHKDVFGRMAWGLPAPTLTRRCTDVYCGRFIHPEQDRGLSLREAAAIQTFPDKYEFFGSSINQIAGQIGNAVPVELARRLGNAIIASNARIKD